MKILLKSKSSKVRPLMDEVFILIGKMIMFAGAFFAIFYTIGVLYTLMSPLINKIFDLTMDNISVMLVVLFAVMLVSCLFSIHYENVADFKKSMSVERKRKLLAKRQIKLYNLKDNTEVQF